jgi:hypothetical protein
MVSSMGLCAVRRTEASSGGGCGACSCECGVRPDPISSPWGLALGGRRRHDERNALGSSFQSHVYERARCATPSHASHVGRQSSDVSTTRTTSHASDARAQAGLSYARILRPVRARCTASPSDHDPRKTCQRRRQMLQRGQPIVVRARSKLSSAAMTRACRVPPMPPLRRRHLSPFLTAWIRLSC